MCRDGNVQMGACRPEHADGSMPTGECERNCEKEVIIGFVVFLWTRYLCRDEIVQTGACKKEHVDGRVRTGACEWEHC